MSITFSCHSCGHCCRQMGARLQQFAWGPLFMQQAARDFPHALTSAGACSQLLPDGRCGAYETRPLICRVDDFYDQFLTQAMSRADWHTLNAAGCPPTPSPAGASS